jgi:hypothetical protein
MSTKGKEVAQAQTTAPSVHEEAYNKALEEISEERVKEVKNIAKTILQQIQKYKEQKEEAEEAMRLLKLDLDDLREGKIEKIRERHEKSKKAEEYSPITIPGSWNTWTSINGGPWTTTTAGNGSITYIDAGGSAGNSTLASGVGGTYSNSASVSVNNLFAQAQELHNKLWNDLTSGTYTITTRNGTREFYL